MLTSIELSNINKRIRVLKLIFNVEDSLVKSLRLFYSQNTILIDDFISPDKNREDFLTTLRFRANKNTAISSTFNNNELKIHDFIEVSSMGDLIAIIKYAKPGLKWQISPPGWNYKQTEIIYNNLTMLRNKVSHSSLKPIDDHIYGLPQITKRIVDGVTDRKLQYSTVIKKISKHFNSNLKNYEF